MRFLMSRASFPAAIAAAMVMMLACSAPAEAPSSATSPGIAAVPSSASAPTDSPRYSAYSVVDATTQPPGSILITMTNYAFTPSTLALPAGKVVLYLVNATSAEGYKPGGILGVHNLSLREPSRGSLVNVVAVTPNVAPGKAAILTIDALPAGIYRATCAVGEHAALGMVADITAK